jgi:hypothetical protein
MGTQTPKMDRASWLLATAFVFLLVIGGTLLLRALLLVLA